MIIYASDDDGNQNTSLNSAISQFISPSAQDTKTSKHLAILISRNFLSKKFIEEQNIAKKFYLKKIGIQKKVIGPKLHLPKTLFTES